jgi:hypothetical protein
MRSRFLLRLVGSLVTLAVTGGAVLAQAGVCQRYRAELASLDREGGRSRQMAALSQQQGQEIARLAAYYNSIGCDRGGFLFFSPPPECSAISQRIRMMQASYGQVANQTDPHANAARRRQLVAAIQQACDPEAIRIEQPRAAFDVERAGGGGGSKLICVRSCDGSFFPLQNLPDGRAGADEMCQALCPGAEAAAYRVPGGSDVQLERAVSLKGQPYRRLANAFKYQKSFDQGCSCRKPGQSWVEALRKAEQLNGRERGDIFVTAKKADELSRPKLVSRAKPGLAPKPATVAAKVVDVETTGSIGTKVNLNTESPDTPDQAEETKSLAETEKSAIRVVTPTVTPGPQSSIAR